MKEELTQDQIAADNMKFRFSNPYKQYVGTKNFGCIIYWIYVFAGLKYSENCCAQEDKTITVTPFSSELLATSYEWVEDVPGVFRPRFEFAPEFAWAAKEQEIYEKYLLNK